MTLKGKHIVEEISGVRCTIVEKSASANRLGFLKQLLEFNHFEVIVSEEKGTDDAAVNYTIGVTDLVFNPVIAVYEMSLITPNGEKVSPTYWNQQSDECNDAYWEFKAK